ncbi:MAG: phosphoethanolamine--lipid A transferase [Chromatiales bacterium]|jgi:lipid A ethanolaminephosphotransferase
MQAVSRIRFESSTGMLAILFSLYLNLFLNSKFWSEVGKIADPASADGFAVFVGLFFIMFAPMALLALAFSQKYLFKPFLILFLLICSAISYFQNEYGIIVNDSMLLNVLQTDSHEAGEQITLPFLQFMLTFGLLPSVLVVAVKIRRQSFRREMLNRLLYAVGIVLLTVVIGWWNYKSITLFGGENRELKIYMNPIETLHSVRQLITAHIETAARPKQLIGQDAKQRQISKYRKIVVLVIGETARAQNFSLNGYARETNPMLQQRDVLSYRQVNACGTSTAESVPCIFSILEHSNFSPAEAAHYNNILDVLQTAGIETLWFDNNSGSKRVASEEQTIQLTDEEKARWCNPSECFDEVLVRQLEQVVGVGDKDVLVVLHQKGSHGPAYYKRHPQSFTRFAPECEGNTPQNCTLDELKNAYDNTILYTDFVLARIIDTLQQKAPQAESLMLYVSDHGESLGENGIYLHGLPYFLAPDEQIRVPFILWLSGPFADHNGVNTRCLGDKLDTAYSHDNIFHSLLGMFDVSTSLYKQKLDLLEPCRTAASNQLNSNDIASSR